MPTITLRIQLRDFEVPLRYSAGHVLNEAEAQALNQMYCENVRNNVAKWVVRARNRDKTISPEAHADLQARITKYANDYQFRVAIKPRAASPLEAAIDEIAREKAEVHGQKFGYLPNSPEVQLRYLNLKSDPEVLRQASELVRRRQQTLKGIV